MEDRMILIRDEEEVTPTNNDDPKLITDDAYFCTTCPYHVEILKIDGKENTLTFKCLNPKDKKVRKNSSN